MSDLFGKRLRAAEGSYAREDDKVRLKKLREYLIKTGHLKPEDLKPPEPKSMELSVDVMSSISANELPIRDLGNSAAVMNSSAVVRLSVVAPPDLERGAPELPSQSRVMGEIYQAHMGRNWFNSLFKLMQPRDQTGGGLDDLVRSFQPNERRMRTAIGGYPLALNSRRQMNAVKLAAEAKATSAAMASIVLGTVCCLAGAIVAGTFTWRYLGSPNSSSFLSQRKERWQERARAINQGSVGHTIRTIGETAAIAIPEHEGLQNLATGLKKQFNSSAATESNRGVE